MNMSAKMQNEEYVKQIRDIGINQTDFKGSLNINELETKFK